MSNWKVLAAQESQIQGCDLTIVLATVDAESSGNNELNDIGCVGYGQINVPYHYDAYQYAAQRLGISLPAEGDTKGLINLTLQNDQLSMIISVFVIKQYWAQAAGDFVQFTKLYEGPDATDIDRRYNIYQQYLDQSNSNTSALSGTNVHTGADVITIARQYLGVPYVWGGADPSGFDCSGLVQYCYSQIGIDLPRTTYDQVTKGIDVGSNPLQEGDLMFFDSTGHVAMYSGNGNMIEAPHTGANVREVTARTPENVRRIISANSGSYGSGTPLNGLSIPATNYSIVNNSKQSTGVIYGRRYRVLVSNSEGVALDVSKLKCTFNIQKTMRMQANYSTITIYNLSAQTENTIIQEGNRVVLEAGYEGEQYGLIFDGTVIQPLRNKLDGVDYTLTLNSLDGDGFLNGGVVNFSVLKGQTHRDITGTIASKASTPTQLGTISQKFDNTQLTRGKVCFGLGKEYLRQIAQSQGATFYMDNGMVNIIKLDDLPVDEIIELSPASGLIGVPAQTEYGVSFKCLLNPRIKLNTLVHIDNTLVQDLQAQLGQVIRSLDSSGIYRIIKINDIGDTMGDDWQCECEAVSQAGMVPSLMNSASANMNPF
jgi:cell wall-associated NlpC family hydrolase